jgi:predicted transport protein
MVIFKDNKYYTKYTYKTESEFETDVVENALVFFGKKAIYIDVKRKLTSKALGNSIPDGFLFDLKDIENPEFYIVEAELITHDFYSHIFPQITKFFSFFKNYETRRELVEKLYTIINFETSLKKQFKDMIGANELYKYLADMIENSQNILLVIDGEKKELPEIISTYTDTWGKVVKVQIVKKYINNSDVIFTMDPEFEAIEFSLFQSVGEISETNDEIDEEYHLGAVKEETRIIYETIKARLLEHNSELIFNPQKYYISLINEKNVLFFKIRKKKIRIIPLIPFPTIQEKVKNYPIVELSESVQNFYNGQCGAIDIDNLKNSDEIIELLKPLIRKNGGNDT